MYIFDALRQLKQCRDNLKQLQNAGHTTTLGRGEMIMITRGRDPTLVPFDNENSR
jgi:hypothetical protein